MNKSENIKQLQFGNHTNSTKESFKKYVRRAGGGDL